MTNSLDFETDLAQLALRGYRFEEAENRFLEIAKISNSSLAWCGVALAKSGLVYSGNSTVGEIFYCFDKAITVEPENNEDVKKIVYGCVIKMISSFADYYASALAQEKDAEWQKTKGYIFGIGSAVVGAANERQSKFTNLSALGGEVLGFATVANAQSKLSSARFKKERVIELINDLKSKSLDFFKSDTEEYKKLNDSVNSTLRTLVNPVTQYLTGTFINANKPKLRPEEIFQLVDARINSYKKTRNTWGWVLVFIAACSLFGGLYLEAGETIDSERFDKIALGVGLIIAAIVLFVQASGMTFEKMEEIVKKELGIKD